MGKNKDQKKKESTIQKVPTKAKQKIEKEIKKQIERLGEENIEKLITQEINKSNVTETVIIDEPTQQPPSRRANVSLTEHPSKDELILFGGEFFDGRLTHVYNDLFIYDIKQNHWKRVQTPQPPAPRSSHQAVSVNIRDGELWLFGGEYTSASQSQFYHYNDLYVLHLSTFRWEKLNVSANGPSGRSGHRMTTANRQLFIFGGFQDYITTYRYFNDLYSFCLDSFQWTQIKLVGQVPSPRSAAPIVTSQDGSTLFIINGYSKQNEDKGVTHSEVFTLTKEQTTWHSRQSAVSGAKPDMRCGSSVQPFLNYCILFGGVMDMESDGIGTTASAFLKSSTKDSKKMRSVFFNDLHRLDLQRLKWFPIETKNNKEASADDRPSSRMNSAMAIKNGVIYLYGGLKELDEKKQYTFGDFYSLDLHKLDSWTCLCADDRQAEAHIYSDSSSSDDEDEKMDENDDSSSSSDGSNDESIEIEAPDSIPSESVDEYFHRTREFWLNEARKELKINDETDESVRVQDFAQQMSKRFFKC